MKLSTLMNTSIKQALVGSALFLLPIAPAFSDKSQETVTFSRGTPLEMEILKEERTGSGMLSIHTDDSLDRAAMMEERKQASRLITAKCDEEVASKREYKNQNLTPTQAENFIKDIRECRKRLAAESRLDSDKKNKRQNIKQK